ncbi:MAG: urate hydroxylase PuuD [Acidobacteria bacterium]|nr:urate hydroxylase PuuD [Acidobacteriota bacterium]
MADWLNEWLNVVFRWAHVIAGVMWIGHLWFFNFVNSQVAKTFDADSKRKVVPELMPRALFWFRWGAAWTFITGILLLGIVYYMGGNLLRPDCTWSAGVGTMVGLGVMIVGFFIYDLLWNTGLKGKPFIGTVISLVLLSCAAWGMSCIFSGRAVFIHIGAIFGTAMAANVWMRIWPAQRKIIAAIRDGQAPDGALVAVAGMRSKHNTYMSVPLLFLMISNHYPTVYGGNNSWMYAIGFVIVGFLFTYWMYAKSASASPSKY